MDRQIYVQAPKDGLPSLPHMKLPAVTPQALMQVIKGAYGLAEAPRLWYLEAVRKMKCRFIELACCRGTFVLLDSMTTPVIAICCLHVDDGLLAMMENHPECQAAYAKINEEFNSKEWKVPMEKPTEYLGEVVIQNKDYSIRRHQKGYVDMIPEIYVKRGEAR